MENEPEIVVAQTGDVMQRIPGKKNRWTIIEAHHPLSTGPGGRFKKCKNSNDFFHAGGPTTWQERDDFYRRFNSEPVAFTRRQSAAEKVHKP